MADLPMGELGIGLPNVWQTDTLFVEEAMTQPDLMGECFGSTIYTNRVWDTQAGPGYVRWDTGYVDSSGTLYPGPGTFGVHTSDYCVEYVEELNTVVEVPAPLWTPGQPDLTRDCELWLPLDGDLFGKAPGTFTSQLNGTGSFCPAGSGMGLAQDPTNPLRNVGVNAALDPSTYTPAWSFTICMGVWMWAYRPSCAWSRCDVFTGSQSVYQWYQGGDGHMRVGHDKPDWESATSVTPLIPPLFQWNFLALTMNADGITGTFTLNDQTEPYALTTISTKTGQPFTLGDSWNTAPMDGAFSAVLIESRVESPSELQVIRQSMMNGL